MQRQTFKKVSPYCLLILLQSILYGIGDPLSKSAYEAMSVYSLLSARYSIALVLLVLMGRGRILANLKKCPPKVWLLPSLCIAGCYILNNVALELTAATTVAFLRSLSTVMTPLLAFAVYRTRYHWLHIPIQGLIVVGLYLLCGMGGLSGFGLGEILTLLSALLMAGALVFGGQALEQVDAITLSTVQTSASVLMAVVCAFLFDGGIYLAETTTQNWGIIFYLAALCTLAGYLLQNLALEKISSRTVALLQCFCPVMTTVFSFLILGEQLSLQGILGALILLLCVVAETLLPDERQSQKA